MDNKRIIDYRNDKLNQIFDLTWPNIGWAKTMNDKPINKILEIDIVDD